MWCLGPRAGLNPVDVVAKLLAKLTVMEGHEPSRVT